LRAPVGGGGCGTPLARSRRGAPARVGRTRLRLRSRPATRTVLRELQSVRDVPRAAWDALVGDGSPFLEWKWLVALEEWGAATAAPGWLPRPLTLWDGDRLVGACPLYLKGHSLGEFVFDQSWASAAMRAGIQYYPKLLVAAPFTPATGVRFLTG